MPNMSDIQIFEFNEKPLSVLMENGEPYFFAKEVCEALQLSDVSMATRNVDDEDKLVQTLLVSGQNRQVTLINESGLYSLVIRSNKPEAKAFKRWVTNEVIPSIRKHGVYATPAALAKMLSDPGSVAVILEALQAQQIETAKERTAKEVAINNLETKEVELSLANKTIKEQAPIQKYATEVLNAANLIETRIVASHLGMSAKKLNLLLSKLGVQYKHGETWYMYATHINKGYHGYRTFTRVNSLGQTVTEKHMYWTELGQKAVIELITKYQTKIAAQKLAAA